jgi:hypothetical protein
MIEFDLMSVSIELVRKCILEALLNLVQTQSFICLSKQKPALTKMYGVDPYLEQTIL